MKKSKCFHLAISGTPGCGKSTLAWQISRLLNITYIDLTSLIKTKKLYSKYDKIAKTYDVKISVLEKYLLNNLDLDQSYILDSHLSHHLSHKLVSHVIVCNCDLKTLNKRLIKRKYSSKKIKDNLEAEIFDVCFNEALENGFDALKINCTKKLNYKKIKSHLRQLRLLH